MTRVPCPLSGRRILVTQSPERGDALTAQLAGDGAEVVQRAAIRFELPLDEAAADGAVRELDSFAWLVLTSPTGVAFFMERLKASGAGSIPPAVQVAAVGPGTARALRQAGRVPDLVPDQADAAGLAGELAGEPLEGRPVLWVRPEGAEPTLAELLEKAGAMVRSAVFYRTVPHPECREIAADLVAGRFDGILFTSPSTFRGILDALPEGGLEPFRQVTRVAIGRVTAAAMVAAGCPPGAVASRPTAGGVAAAFRAAFGPAPLC